jgi:hypothetical protein
MSTWSKETQIISMYYSEYFMKYAPFTPTSMRADVEEYMIIEGLTGPARELLLSALNNVDWHDLAETYNLVAEEEMLFDEL